MQRHIKEYFDKMGLSPHDWNPCELDGQKMQDVHHVVPRSKFGSKRKGTEPGEQDHIDNLIGLCRSCHEAAHAGKMNERIDAAIKARKLNIGLI